MFSVLTAIGLGLQLLPRPPNVEFTSTITFTAGVVFGSIMGIFLGAFVMFVNSFLSPWGFTGLNMPFQMTGMSIIGIAGGLYSKTIHKGDSRQSYLEVAILGAFLTIIYDIITDLGFATQGVLFTKIPLSDVFISLIITGALFSVLHVASNTLLFTSSIPMAKAIRELLRK